ncbi:MAG: protein-(glutamine-N5) methyltransferase, release factor-specific [Acidobacteria bacterium RIFCSPLOWO2_12_FULL_65_11]|nr:MAG: protein-(glutamine-N5) methyltransferase, release factor-specific [Acidobacteria bacterium RIFCSPLOWO2_02_FULL_64_15]OFW32143.1 MAG: protein-(glutamine-N5) methyltransferase, release factor-specific [Acidobacteria bacterium RIFCSPLOWO2_12_FULL_65_11]
MLKPPTVREHVADGCQRLREAGIPADQAGLDARLIAQSVLGWTTERLLTSGSEPVPKDFARHYGARLGRRVGREPLAYVLGQKEFWGLAMEVSPAVLIPRPETELIVEAALELGAETASSLTIADVCTGSGCIAVALAHERPSARVIATDISKAALAIARRNAVRHGVADRVQFSCANLLDGVTDPFDLIVCNPPYVAERDRPALQPEVRDHEPGIALFSGPDGLDVIGRLIAQAPARLVSGGHLLFEFGFGQDQVIEDLIARASGLRLVELRRDLQGIARTAVAERA